jgi:endonuclease/exonuclease/phosphatase (EEP) superfamily protein YafD
LPAGANDATLAAMRIRIFAAVTLAAWLASCVTIPPEPRAIVYGTGGKPQIEALGCNGEPPRRLAADAAPGAALGRGPLSLVSWNIHKQADPGWQDDLAGYAASADVVLVQEAVFDPGLKAVVSSAGMRYLLASSFEYQDNDIGVLTLSRVPPDAACIQRAVEPLLRIPKSAVIAWLPIADTKTSLAIANIHAINFDLLIGSYRTQLQALADAVAIHEGPLILAGDFNTWNDARDQVLAETAARLGLVEVALTDDRRTRFYGRHLDHVFVRGVRVIAAEAIPVQSSDHNPMRVTFELDASGLHAADAADPATARGRMP